MKKMKRIFAVILATIMLVSAIPMNCIPVSAAAKSATVSTQSRLNSALKKKSITSIKVSTKKKVSFSVKNKNYKKKKLTINGSKISFKNSASFKSIYIDNVRSYVEKGTGNILNVRDSSATIEVAKSAKKTSVIIDRNKAKINLKANGKISSIKVKKNATLSVSGTPGSTLYLSNHGLNSKISVNAKANTNITLNKNAVVSIGSYVKSAVIILAQNVTGDIRNNSGKSITVKKNGKSSVTIPAKTSMKVTNDGSDDKEVTPQQSYVVTFETNGGSEVQNQVVEEGKTILRPQDPTWYGFKFIGWYKDSSLKRKYDFNTKITADTTLYAKWKVEDNSDTLRTVTFVLNDGRDGAYQMQTVKNNQCAERPLSNPSRSGYAFIGWYEDATLANEYDFSEPVTSDLTIYAGWGNPDGSDGLYDSENGGGTTYAITSLKVLQDSVEVKVNVDSSSILVVGFYDQEGYFEEGSTWSVDTARNYGNIAVRTPSYCEATSLYLEKDSSIHLPDYYIVVGALYDAETLEPVCEKFICADYTEENHQFEQLTIDDFEEETVLNFDQNLDDNFGVLSEDIKEIHCTYYNDILSVQTENISDAEGNVLEKNTFTISNPTRTVKNLVAGDKIVIYESGVAKYLAKIEGISSSSGKVVITESMDTDMTDFYSVLKVDMDEQEVPPSEEEFAPMANVIDADATAKVSIGKNIHWSINSRLELSGELKGTAELSIKIKYDARLFRKDYFECSIISDLSGTFEIKLEGTAYDNSDDVKKELEGVKVKFKTPIVGLDAYTACTFPVEVSLKGSVSLTIKFNMTNGFEYNTNSGRQDVEKKNYSVDFKGEAEFEVKAGPKFTIGVTFIKDKLDASIEAQIGAKITATLTISQDDEISDVDSKHACYTCLSGKAKWFAEVNIKLKYKIIKDVLEGTAFDITVLSIEGWLNPLGLYPGQFYLSLWNASDSIYGGEKKFGWGSCKNEKYRTVVETYDADDNKVYGNRVTIVKNNGDVVKSGSSDLKTYLYNGVYTVSGTINGKEVSSSFIIDQASKIVALKETSNKTTQIKGNVRDAFTQNWLGGVTVQFKKGDLVIASTTSQSDGSFSADLPADSYEVEVSKEDYVTVITNETIIENEIKYMEVIDLVPGDEGKGGFSGHITDALTGKYVSDVKLDVRAGANSPESEDILITVKTDRNGYFEYNPDPFFGVYRGLSAGQYTVTATKNGYIKTSFNIVVRENEVVGNQNATISPKLDDDEFRIVLRWGSSPSDLDSHYKAIGINDHVFYSRKGGSTANLDVDDTSSYGPETITVTDFSATDGFVYSVHDFTNRGSYSSTRLSYSGAYITVYHGEYTPVTFHVPVGFTGTVWNVFRVDSNGNITALNTFENISDPYNVGSGF